jgi:hypothetical protein
MRNHIPEVTEAVVIEDFYWGSNDSAFVRAILKKAPATSEQLFREADLYITMDERAQYLIGDTKPAPRRDTNQQPDRHLEKRGPARRCTPPGHPSLEPAAHPAEVYGHWMKSSTPSAHTTRTCATPYGTVGTSSIPSGMADHSNFYRLPHREESLASPGSLDNKRGEGVELFHAFTGRSTLSSKAMEHKRTGGSKRSTTGRSWWLPPVPRLLTCGRSTR